MKRQQELLTKFFKKGMGATAANSSISEDPPELESIEPESSQPESPERENSQPKRPKAVHPLDVGQYVKINGAVPSPLTEEKRYEILTNCWKPDENYVFPKILQSGQSRSFQLHYLQKWPWLAYSEFQGGAFCKTCVTFARTESSGQGRQWSFGALVIKPLTKYKNATRIFETHEAMLYHKNAEIDATKFIEWYENKELPDIRSLVDQGRQQQVLRNRSRLIPIVKTVFLCGKQGLALRGHRENGDVVRNTTEAEGSNDGNFRALLRFRIDAGDESLKEHLIDGPRNATYTSPKVQNQIIDAIGKLIRKRIVTEVNAAKFFCILADETRDISKVDQLTLCLRYVTPNGDQLVLRENFLSFCPVTSKTGAALAEAIMRVLRDEGVAIENMRGQGYDGCSSMRGIYNGVQAEIKKIVPQALYFHCASHCLNLALAHSVGNTTIKLTIGTIASSCSFLTASSHRVRLLQEEVQTTLPESRAQRLKPLCVTRWVESHKAFITFKELLIPIVRTLETVANEKGDSGARANELLSAICKCEFVVSLLVTESFSALLLPLSKQLQSKNLDIFEAREMIENMTKVLKVSREEADQEFQKVYTEATALCAKLDIDLKLPRLCGKQTNRENYSVASLDEYFRVSVYLPYLDRLIEEFNSLFNDMRGSAAKLQCLIPKYINKSSFDDLAEVVDFYQTDLSCSASVLEQEFRRWKTKWTMDSADPKPANAIDALNHCSPLSFPKIALLLRIFATLPVSTSSAERSFSCLRRLKTYLRSTMKEERLNGLTSMHMQPDIDITAEEVIDLLALDSRRLDFVL